MLFLIFLGIVVFLRSHEVVFVFARKRVDSLNGIWKRLWQINSDMRSLHLTHRTNQLFPLSASFRIFPWRVLVSRQHETWLIPADMKEQLNFLNCTKFLKTSVFFFFL